MYTLSFAFDPSNFFFWSGVFNAVSALGAMIIVLRHGKRNVTNRRFAGFSLSIFTWASFYAIWQLSADAKTALFWSRVLMLGAIFASVTLLAFTISVLGENNGRSEKLIKGLFVFFTAFAFLDVLTPWFVSHVESMRSFPFWPKPGVLFHPFFVVWTATLFYAYYRLHKGYRAAHGLHKKQLSIIFLGFLLGVLAGSTNYLPWYGINIIPWLTPLTSAYVIMAVFAMMRYRLFRITPETVASTIIDTINDALFVTDGEGRVRIVNPAAQKILKAGDVIVGKPLRNFLELKDSNAEVSEGALKTLQGKKILVSASLRTLPGKENGKTIICHDISTYKEHIAVIENQKRLIEEHSNKLKEASRRLKDDGEEISRVNKVLVGREMQMIKLKEENLELKKRIDKLEQKS